MIGANAPCPMCGDQGQENGCSECGRNPQERDVPCSEVAKTQVYKPCIKFG
ncbi:MAG: hypothetical protein WC303_00965 [Candidatus Paceibacterota bacterium]